MRRTALLALATALLLLAAGVACGTSSTGGSGGSGGIAGQGGAGGSGGAGGGAGMGGSGGSGGYPECENEQPSGTYTCNDLLVCSGTCEFQASCYCGCIHQASPSAAEAFRPLLRCAIEQKCTDASCAESGCPYQLIGCSGVGGAGGA